ncbi:MAG: aldo/keto reductase [Ruminococcaceae bacterium]|nr:aldo/keto reductase [Oscillospiraceae bacterium]
MKYREFEKLGTKTSMLGFGGMRFPIRKDKKIARRESKAMIDRAYKNGVNYFDTAYGYHGGDSEYFFGEALAKYPRESYYLADKLPSWYVKELADVDRLLDEQLKKTKQEYFDFYLVHAVNNDHFENFEKLGAFERLREIQKTGKFRHLGFSFHDTPEVLEKVVDKWKPDFVQIQLNYLDWKLIDAKKMYEILEERDIPVIIMEPVRGGRLQNLPKIFSDKLQAVTDGSNAAVAFRWIGQLKNVICILSGMSNMEQVEDNLNTFDELKPLTAEEMRVTEEITDRLMEQGAVPCTACNYCDVCPKQIAIPKIFAAFNDYKASGDGEAYKNSYAEIEEGHREKDCIACGKCVKMCPQMINIPDILAYIAARRA